MNLDNISSGTLGGLIGGGLILLRDILWGVNKKMAKLETKLDKDIEAMERTLARVMDHETCEIIRQDTKSHMAEMTKDMRYIRQRLDDVMASVQRHREDYSK